ncbi:unnamed protein product [Soboliphyme baturini]|uniref:Uncharacterized protein n=1 Tax=Soboliphyme baturini TaxID=241478 RepID=A0A183J2A5_9BILA|nr:unnamed protein product [Soboliphyme baturini]
MLWARGAERPEATVNSETSQRQERVCVWSHMPLGQRPTAGQRRRCPPPATRSRATSCCGRLRTMRISHGLGVNGLKTNTNHTTALFSVSLH